MARTPDSVIGEDRRAAHTRRLLAEAQRDADRRPGLHQDAARLNMALARSLAARYRGRGVATDDLTQVAYVGLMKAIKGFDPAHDSDFRSYAVPTILGELRRHFRDRSWMVRPPRRIQELQADISAARDDLVHQLLRQPDEDELAARLHVPVTDVREALSARGCFAPASLDDRGPEDRFAPCESLVADQVDFERTETRISLAPVIHRLSERDRHILWLRFFRGCTQSQIGSDIGVSQVEVSRRLRRILENLRSELSAA